MSDTAAALRAAREVSADSLAPEKYRRATEAFFKAQNEYRMKNFQIAEDFAAKAKRLAEESEFDALRQGSSRTSLLPPEVPVPPPEPSTIEPPVGELATEVMKRPAGGSPSTGTGGGSGPGGTGTGTGGGNAPNNGTGGGASYPNGGSGGSTGTPQQFPPNFSP